jgi:RecA-family ATPase
MKNERDYETVKRMLEENMVEGGMHVALRDAGRLAGGMLSAGRLSLADVDSLRSVACGLSVNRKEAELKWDAAVEYGRRQPLDATRRPDRGGAMDWDDPIYIGEESTKPLIDQNYVESDAIPDPVADFEGNDIIRYLSAMFQPDEHVGIVADSYVNESGKHLPKRGVWDRTAGQLIDALREAGSDYKAVLGDYDPACGVWVRINPLDGKGCKDDNVTALRHTLIEADDQDLGKQLALIRQIRIPCSCVVHSGGRSIHALVRVDAATMEEYRTRVDYLYTVCRKNGLKVDSANRNPSRLSRLPGVIRGDGRQYIIASESSAASWDEWVEWIEKETDSLPDIVCMNTVFSRPAQLAPELIEGILRVGHKMRITGPSKAGKSFALISMAAAIAEGRDWMGFKCSQGKVLYINAEISPESFYERIRTVYRSLGFEPNNLRNISAWNLRGKTVPLENLVPSLIRRCKQQGFSVVIIDPIYKLNWGDENDAGQSSRFCNLLERICSDLGVSIIDCHHHSKGSQGQKNSMDRGSGSGVFSRDPDAILDMIELPISDERREKLTDYMVAEALLALAEREGVDLDDWPEQDRQPADAALMAFQGAFPKLGVESASVVCDARTVADRMTGWRIEATLREFAPINKRNVLFRHPVHLIDTTDILLDAKPLGEEAPWEAKAAAQRAAKAAAKEADNMALEQAIELLGGPGSVTVNMVAEHIGKSARTVKRSIENHGGFSTNRGVIMTRQEEE